MHESTLYSDEELKKIQSLELEILKEVIRVCEQTKIEYFLIGGSALGAVRHNGFIPWDDDIDIGMTRDNYDRFLKEAPSFLSEKYELQSPYNGKHNPYPYSKVRMNGTIFMEYANHRNKRMNHGVYIDIFPFDMVPDDERKNIKQFNRVRWLSNIHTYKHSASISQPAKTFKQQIKAFIRFLMHLFYSMIPNKILLKKLNFEMTKYNGTSQKAIACLLFPHRKKEYIAIEDIYPLRICYFVDITAFIPNNFDKYLQTHYGNWKSLPPVEKRCAHRPCKVELK